MPALTTKKLSALHAGTVNIGSFIVNRLGFNAKDLTGHNLWGPPQDLSGAKKLLLRAIDLDINFIDTANVYGPGISEQLIHDFVGPYEGIIVATKGGVIHDSPGKWHADGSPESLRAACEASMQHLDVHQIVLYQLQMPDPTFPFSASLQTLIELQQAGKVRYIGLGNVSFEQLQAAHKQTHIATVRNPFTIDAKGQNKQIIQFCEDQGITFIPNIPRAYVMSDQARTLLAELAQAYRAHPEQIEIAWMLAQSPMVLALTNSQSIAQLERQIAATSLELDAADIIRLNSLSD